MSLHAATWYGAKMAVFARATFAPRSKTSGARSWPRNWLAALISSWLFASGWAESMVMPYLAWNALMISP
jgi:hypothetical protein